MTRKAPGEITRTGKSKSAGQRVESVSRALRLLEAFAVSLKPLSLSQLAAAGGGSIRAPRSSRLGSKAKRFTQDRRY